MDRGQTPLLTPLGPEHRNGVVPPQRLASVEEFERVEPPLPGQGLVDRSAGPTQPLGQRPDGEPELLGAASEPEGEGLVAAPLERLLGLEGLRFYLGSGWHKEERP